jgi:hypothetical protein
MCILFVAPSCLDEAHEVVREIAKEAMEINAMFTLIIVSSIRAPNG